MSNITNRRNESLPNYKKKEKGTVFIPKEQEGYVISLLNTMFSSRNNSNQNNSNSSECAGTYPVSGYTRSNGVEVSDYMRTCGAAHAGNGKNSNKTIRKIITITMKIIKIIPHLFLKQELKKIR